MVEGHHLCSEAPQIWELKTSPKNADFFGKNKTARTGEQKKTNGQGTQTRIIEKKMCICVFFSPRRYWVKKARHSENRIAKKWYTSIAACVGYCTPNFTTEK